MNQGKVEVVKQEMARVNIDILGFSELKWTGMGEFNSDDHYINYCGQKSIRRNGVAIMVNKRVHNAVLGCIFVLKACQLTEPGTYSSGGRPSTHHSLMESEPEWGIGQRVRKKRKQAGVGAGLRP